MMSDVDAARVLATREDELRVPLSCGHVARPLLSLTPNWRDLADTPGRGVAGAVGYTTEAETGKQICYDCATVRDRALMRAAKPGDRFVAYVSADNKLVTNWPGGVLGGVLSIRDSRAARKVFVRVRAVDGSLWSGQGPRDSGTYVTLRRLKG